MLGDAAEIQEKREREEFYNNPLARTIIRLVDTNNGEYTGRAKEIIDAAPYFRQRIYKNATQVGREITKLAPLLKKYYSIEHYVPSNGNASASHTFRKVV